MNYSLEKLFSEKKSPLLSIYYTAGFPQLDYTLDIAIALQEAGADMIEIGMPFSDPVADGETIQKSNQAALQNGMHIPLLFEQLSELKSKVHIPVLLMGYLNPVMQYGIENFCKKASEIGVQGIILPDLPIDVYENEYKEIFEAYHLPLVFLITPQSPESRIRKIDSLSNSFIYMVSTSSTTGKTEAMTSEQIDYFERIKGMQLKNPCMIGFGISDNQGFETAGQYARGAIVGSAFIKALAAIKGDLKGSISSFVKNIRNVQ